MSSSKTKAVAKKTVKKKTKPEVEIPTLYDQMLANFLALGFEVEEGSWEESTGYPEPTEEYWFDVTLLFDLNTKKKITGHYFFGADKNVFIDHSVWTMDIVIEENNCVKISK